MKIQCLAATLAIIGQNPADAFLFPNQRKPFRVSSTSLNQQKAFVNDGAFSFMQPFLGVFEEGKTTNYAVPLPVDEADIPSEEEQIMRRTEAAANMTNIGMWDVDGTGIRKIEDDNLARAIMTKVNDMNVNTGFEAFALAGAFAALPQEISFKVAACSLLLGGLYGLQGRIPK